MNKLLSYKNPKKRAQALVEFALIVPVLMMILYGVIETGRYLFILSSTLTAARQAVRYGTALGDSPAGTEYYNDCAGIEAAARKVQFLNKFQTVSISYDQGLNSDGTAKPFTGSPTPIPTCPSGGTGTLNPVSGNRVIVTVTAQYTPIISLLPIKPFLVRFTSARTILTDISIFVPPVVPNQGLPVLSIISPALTPTPTYSAANQSIIFTFRFTNNGNGTGVLNPPFTVDTVINGNTVTITCTGAPASLAVGSSFDCAVNYTYTTTVADMDAGSFTGYSLGKAMSNGNLLSSVGMPFTFIAIQNPVVLLQSITANPTKATVAGTQITYTYTFKNNGTVSIRGPYTITDDHASNFNCTAANAASPLAPGSATTLSCTGTYNITQADIDNEILVNTATVTGTYGAAGLTTPASNSVQATVITGKFLMSVTASPSSSASAVNQVITYYYTIYNNTGGQITVQGVTDTKVPSNGSCVNKVVADNGVLNCTGTYTITTADYDAGNPINSSVYARTSTLTTKTKTTSVSLVQNKILTLSLVSATTSWATGSTANVGNTVTYVYSLKNDGNVTLAAPFTINNGTLTTCSSISSLAPTISANCTLATSHIVTQADIDAGSITKIATASATFNGVPVLSNPISALSITYPAARFKVGVTAVPTTPITTTAAQATFTYTITNTGGKNLTTFNITTSQFTTAFPCAGPIAVGAAPMTCTKTITPGATFTDTITSANAKDGGTTVTSTTFTPASATVYVCNSSTLFSGNPTFNSNNPKKTIETWAISNNVGISLPIKSIKFNWTIGNGTLTSVKLVATSGTTTIFSGSNSTGTFDLTGPWTLNTGPTNLVMNFDKSGFGVVNFGIYTTYSPYEDTTGTCKIFPPPVK